MELEVQAEEVRRAAALVSTVLLVALWWSTGCADESESTTESGSTFEREPTPATTTTPETTISDGPKLVRLTGNLGDPRSTAPTFNISPDGKKVAFTSVSMQDRSPEIYVVGSDGTDLTHNPAPGGGPVWSPDGAKLAFTTVREQEGGPEVYIMNSDGSGQTNLTNNPGHAGDPGTPFDGGPVFLPNGKIAFISQRDGDFEIYMMNSDGTDQTNLTNDPESADTDPSFSADGKKMVFRKCSILEGVCDFYVMNSDGSNQTLVAGNVGAIFPVLSPDGRKIAFRQADQAGKLEIFIMDVDGSDVTDLTDRLGRFVSEPAFLPDGRIAFVSNPARNDEIYVVNQDGTGRINLTNDPTANDGAVDRAPSISADGKEMAFLKAHYDESGRYVSEIYLMDLER